MRFFRLISLRATSFTDRTEKTLTLTGNKLPSPGAVCDSDDNLKCFCTEAGEKSDGGKKSILDSVTCQ